MPRQGVWIERQQARKRGHFSADLGIEIDLCALAQLYRFGLPALPRGLNTGLAAPVWRGALHQFKRGNTFNRSGGRGLILPALGMSRVQGGNCDGNQGGHFSHIRGFPQRYIRAAGEQVPGQSVAATSLIEGLSGTRILNFIACFLGFGAAMPDTVLSGALLFVGFRPGFAGFAEIDRAGHFYCRHFSIASEIAKVSRYFGLSDGRGALVAVIAIISASLLWAAPD